MVPLHIYGAIVLSSEGVTLVCRGYAECGGVVTFASEEGRVRVLEMGECDVDGGVVGETGYVRGTGTGFREIWRRIKASLGSVRDVFRGRGNSASDELFGLSQLRGGRRDDRRMGGSAS